MPTLKTTIFNSAIDINYEEGDKNKLLQLIENLNNRLKKYNHLNGKVSDSKIIILASLAIEDDLMEQKKLISEQSSISNDLNLKEFHVEKLSSEIINLKDKIHKLESKLDERNKRDFLIEDEIEEINEQIENMKVYNSLNYDGNYIYYGVREHAMAAIINGIALHGGLRPYGGSFLVFTDYCRPSIRLSALMKLPTIFVMTHDSIGLGEDGPTHQPVEHLASLRAMPNLKVLRPCDIIETIESWQIALESENPSVIVLTRQNLPLIRKENFKENLVEKGAYIIRNFDNYDATILATGSEVEIAHKASEELEKFQINARVVSIPCFELFDSQSKEYKKQILGSKLCYGIEAGVINGWEKYVNSENFIGMKTFGASGPYKELYKYFGITVDNLVESIKKNLD